MFSDVGHFREILHEVMVRESLPLKQYIMSQDELYELVKKLIVHSTCLVQN